MGRTGMASGNQDTATFPRGETGTGAAYLALDADGYVHEEDVMFSEYLAEQYRGLAAERRPKPALHGRRQRASAVSQGNLGPEADAAIQPHQVARQGADPHGRAVPVGDADSGLHAARLRPRDDAGLQQLDVGLVRRLPGAPEVRGADCPLRHRRGRPRDPARRGRPRCRRRRGAPQSGGRQAARRPEPRALLRGGGGAGRPPHRP